MRSMQTGLVSAVVLALVSGQGLLQSDTASARTKDYPRSGYCPRNLIHVRNVRYCLWFDAQGHRLTREAFLQRARGWHYGVSSLP